MRKKTFILSLVLALVMCMMSPQLVLAAEGDPEQAPDPGALLTAEGDQSFITVQPENAEVNYPEGAEFHVGVSDPEKVATYQWYMTDGYKLFELTGTTAKTDTLTVPSISQDEPDLFFACEITTTDGEKILSEPAVLHILNQDEDKPVLYICDHAVEPGGQLDMADAGIGSGTVTYDADGRNITFQDVKIDNLVVKYDLDAAPGHLLFFESKGTVNDTFYMHFRGDCSFLNTYYSPDYNSGGITFNAFFATKSREEHPTIVIDADGDLTFTGGTNFIYTDADLDITSDIKLETYGDFFADGITCHDLTVESGVSLQIDCHGTAIHTDGDLHLTEGSTVNITSAPAHASVGPTGKNILFIMGSVFMTGSQLNIQGTGKADYFIPFERYLMLLIGIALNGEQSTLRADDSTINIEMSVEPSEVLYAGNFSGIVSGEKENTLELLNGSSVNIKIDTPQSPGATGIQSGGDVILDGDSQIVLNVTGADEVFGLVTDSDVRVVNSTIDSKVTSSTGGKTYGVVFSAADVSLDSAKHSVHSVAENGIAFAGDTGERTDDPVEFTEGYQPTQIVLGGKAEIVTPENAVFGLAAVPGGGTFIKAETVFDPADTSAPAAEVLISAPGSGAGKYALTVAAIAVIAALCAVIAKRSKSKQATEAETKEETKEE